VTGGTSLPNLNCSFNELKVLDVTDCHVLTGLMCIGNQLETLIVSGQANLRWLSCYDNKLTELDLFGTKLADFTSATKTDKGTFDEYSYSSGSGMQVDKTVMLLPSSVTLPDVPVFISSDLQSANYKKDDPATALTVAVTCNGVRTYQWFKDDKEIEDATDDSYTPSTATEGSATYYCVVTNTLNGTSETAQSKSATITVSAEAQPNVPTITTHPKSSGYTVGGVPSALTVVADANGKMTYQWFKDGKEIDGETDDSYTPSTATVGSTTYYCVVTNTLNGTSKTAQSDSATIDVSDSNTPPNVPVFTAQPQPGNYSQNAPATPLSVAVTCNGVRTYQWYKDGEKIAGAIGASYTPVTTTVGSAEYFCAVTNTLNGETETATSNVVKIKITPVVVDTLIVTGGTNSITFSWTDPLPEGIVFQFRKEDATDWITWTGSDAGKTTTIPGLAAGKYTVRIKDAQGNFTNIETGIIVSAAAGDAPIAQKPKVKVGKKNTADASTISTITLNLTAHKNADAKSNALYVITRFEKINKKWVAKEWVSTMDAKYTFTDLKANTSYKFTITAVNEQGSSSNGKKKPKDVAVSITAKTLKYTAVKVKKPVQYLKDGVKMVEATITPPSKIPAGALPYGECEYRLYTVAGKNVSDTPIDSEFYEVKNGILTIDWSKLKLDDSTKHKFVLRAVTKGVESADAKFTIKYSALKAK
jgi:hypothetical protein